MAEKYTKRNYPAIQAGRQGIIAWIAVLLCCTCGLDSFAQENDAQLWINVYLEKKLTHNLAIHLNEETRINENVSQIGFTYGDFGLTYKVTGFMNATAAYVLIEKYYINNSRLNDYFSTRHQFYFNLTFKKDFGPLKVHLREQVQSQVKDIYSSDNGYIPDYYLRNKLTLKYDLTRRLTPYVAFEVYYQLSNIYGNEIDRTRLFGGFFYKLSRQNELELYHMYQQQYNVNNPHADFVTGIGFAHYFK